MGTRGCIGFRFQGTDKLTYKHSDSYPSHLGVKMIETVRTFDDEQLAGTAARLTMVNEDEVPSAELQAKYNGQADTTDDWYWLLREIQGEIAPYVTGGVDHMIEYSGFMANSLFCEWAYILNMDERSLEIYRGFNKDPEAPGRYAALGEGDDMGYRGVRLYTVLPFSHLRSLKDEDVDTVVMILDDTETPVAARLADFFLTVREAVN